MTPEVADSFVDTAAAYVHIPFCSAVCPYCDFAVVAGRDDLVDRYIDALVRDIVMSEPWLPLEAIYFGGGTPSHVDAAMLARILETLDERHGIADNAEISLEANPEDFSAERAGVFNRIGFNRVSFGAQSFDSDVLVSLGRRHQGDQIDAALHAAREAGFENVSLDLIYGEPGETSQSWVETIGRAIDLDPDHVSCYALTVEPGTPLGRAVSDGAAAPDPDTQADRYEVAERLFELSRYEVSNWAREGFECRYNLTVWAQGEYEAYGNGAHGFRDGCRFRNIRHLDTYLDAVESGQQPHAGADAIDGWEREVDRLFVGLRRSVGVALGAGTRALLDSDDGRRLLEAGVIELDDSRLRIVRPMLTDAVHRSVLGLQPSIVSDKSDA